MSSPFDSLLRVLIISQVADFLGTVHHEFHFTVQDGLDALPQVIYHLETCDITTIRASTPMFLLARKIKAMGIKMVMSANACLYANKRQTQYN